MFLSSKAVIIIITMYSLSVMLLVGQWAIADVFGVTLTDFYGNPLPVTVLNLVNQGSGNTIQQNATCSSLSCIVSNVVSTTSNQLGQIVQLFTGTLIFNVLFYLGVPAIMVTAMVFIYIIFLLIFIGSVLYRVTV